MEALKGIKLGAVSLLVEEIPNDPNEKTKGGLLLTSAAAERHNQGLKTGTVVGRGPSGFERGQPLDVDVKVGDKIVYSPPFFDFRYKGILYHMVHFSGYVATLEDE